MDTATVAKANAAAKKAVVCRALAKFVGVLAVGIIEMVREVNEEAAPSCDAAIANITQLTPLCVERVDALVAQADISKEYSAAMKLAEIAQEELVDAKSKKEKAEEELAAAKVKKEEAEEQFEAAKMKKAVVVHHALALTDRLRVAKRRLDAAETAVDDFVEHVKQQDEQKERHVEPRALPSVAISTPIAAAAAAPSATSSKPE